MRVHNCVRELNDPDELSLIEPLFHELHAHQAAVAPRRAHLTARSDAEAWRRRLAHYRFWLATHDSFVLVAPGDGAVVGYVLVTVGDPYDGWESGDRVADVRDLVVAADARGRGVGSHLLAAVRSRLAAMGIREFRISVVAGNTDALEFYRAHGLCEVGHALLGTTS